MFLLCFFINCIKLIKETAVSACVFGYHRKKQARNLCLRDAVLTGGLLVIGTFIETEFLHENAIVLIPIINGVAFYIWKRRSIRESIKAYVLSYMIVEVVDSILYVCIALLANVSVNDLGFSDPIMDGICSLPGLFLWALIYKLQKKKSDVWTLVNRNFWVLFAGGILAAVQVSFLTYIVGDGEIRNVAGETYVVLMMLFGSAVIVCAYLIYIGKLKKRSDRQAEQIRIFEREQKLTRDYYVQLYEKNEKTRARQHERKLLFFHVWWIFVLLFFTICKTKLVSYILPLFPAMAVIIGWNIARMQSRLRHNTTFYGWAAGSGIMFVLLGVGWIIGAQYLPEADFSLVMLGVLTLLLGAAAVFALLYYRDIELASWLHVMIGAVTMCVAFAFVLPVIADRFSVKTMSSVYKEQCEQQTPVYVDKFLRPGFMYYAGKPGIEMIPQTGALTDALRDGSKKYLLVRGLEYRRVQKAGPLPNNVRTVKEISDIYLLEQN